MVVLATADMAYGEDRFTRLNIPDEIARARKMSHLHGRILVLKERGVVLHSNINPAYEALDPERPMEAFRRTLLQLREWGFAVDPTTVPETGPPGPAVAADRRSAESPMNPAEADALVARAAALVPEQRHFSGAPSLAVIVVAAPRQAILRPAELEDPALARRLTQDLLFGDPQLFEAGEGTAAEISGDRLIIRQVRTWLALDAEGSLVVVRPLRRAPASGLGVAAVIEEDVRADIQAVLRFASQVLDRLDRDRRLTHTVPSVALLGVGYGAWRTRAEHIASPSSMTMNVTGGDRASVRLPPAMRSERDPLHDAEDLTVLLRRVSVR
jgi:hypothetical protein